MIPRRLVLAIGAYDLALVVLQVAATGRNLGPVTPGRAAKYAAVWVPIGVVLILAGVLGVR